MELNLEKIKEYQKNRDPYLMIDHVDEVIPGISAKGYKDLKDDWFFKVHWPSDPNMPGMLQIEAMVQMAALSILTLPGNKGKVMYITSADSLKFFKKIKPNSIFNIETEVISYKRGIALCKCQGKIDNEIACKAKITLILPDEILKYNLTKKQ